VTLRAQGPLAPGRYATILLVVPTERHLPTTQVSLEVSDAFLNAGGRLSRVQYPSGWQVEIIKQDKPGEIYEQEMRERAEREEQRAAEAEHSGPAAAADSGQSEQDPAEEEIMNEMRKQWIKRIVFSGGSIPVDAFQEFSLSFQLPDEPGEFRFPAVQTYSDGKEVSWSELVEGAEHPAASIVIPEPDRGRWIWLAAGVVALVLLAFWAGGRRRGTTRPGA
jgi:hypothetical protein